MYLVYIIEQIDIYPFFQIHLNNWTFAYMWDRMEYLVVLPLVSKNS